MKFFCVFIVAGIMALSACANDRSAYIRDGKEYGVTAGLFRDRWWNYYERGLSFFEGGYYEEAARDFRTAIEKRRSDQWRSRTYGMHFVDYFPHRELGIVYFEQKRFGDAERELEESLRSAESSKAKYFLNKARKAILEMTDTDISPPTISIISLVDGFITNKLSLVVRSTVAGEGFVSSLSVNDEPIMLELSAKAVPLEKEIDLKEGTNIIRIRATDLVGKTAEKIVKIEVDRAGPVILVDDVEIHDSKAVVTGFLADRTGINSFSINGQDIHPVEVREESSSSLQESADHVFAFNHEFTLQKGMDALTMKAVDIAGNVTTGELHISPRRETPPGVPAAGPMRLPLLASLVPMGTGFAAEQYTALENTFDKRPPVIFLKDIADKQIVYEDAIFLEGTVSSESRIQSVNINGESLQKRKGKEIYFSHIYRLNEGENRFTIEAVDRSGKGTIKEITVIRKIMKVKQYKSRMSISILPLEHRGERSVSGDTVYDNLIVAFIDQKRFNIVEREKLESLLRELKLSQTELVDPAAASKLGKITAADAILIGTIYETKNSIEVLTRIVDTETSEIIASEDIFDEDKSLPGIKKIMQALALKYRHSCPYLEGLVIKTDGKGIIVDLGGSKRVKKDMRIIVFREGKVINHPVTGKALGSEPVEIGEAKIENVYDEFSRATIRKGLPEKVRIEDRVITK